MKCLTTAVVFVMLLAVPVSAQALGPVVGKGCHAEFTPPATNTDGSPIAGTLTYNAYLVTAPTQPASPPATPTLTGLAASATAVPGLAAGTVATTPGALCAGLAAGQWWLWLSAVETLAVTDTSESALTVTVPFALVIPNPPTNGAMK